MDAVSCSCGVSNLVSASYADIFVSCALLNCSIVNKVSATHDLCISPHFACFAMTKIWIFAFDTVTLAE